MRDYARGNHIVNSKFLWYICKTMNIGINICQAVINAILFACVGNALTAIFKLNYDIYSDYPTR